MDTQIAAKTAPTGKVQTMVETALLIAVTLIMGLTPLGTIRTPILSVSLVTVPVAIAAMLIGPMGAFACGTVFGITSFINALTGASGLLSALLQVSPLGVFVTAIIARMLDGILVGLIFAGLSKVLKGKASAAAYYITGISAPLLNTLFFMSSLMLFFYNSDYMKGVAEKLGAVNPKSLVIAMVGVQGLIEAVTGCIVAGTVGMLVAKALGRKA
ncbi:MAG: ECF transporter S component [Lachnospiraceae bacterium]|nr:ECF transporter S component [Lachnospiraceae bacterium]